MLHTYAYAYFYGDIHCHSNSYCNSDIHTYPYAGRYGYSYGNGDLYAYAHAVANSDVRAIHHQSDRWQHRARHDGHR